MGQATSCAVHGSSVQEFAVGETNKVLLVQAEGHPAVRVFEKPEPGAVVVAEIPSHSEVIRFIDDVHDAKSFYRVQWRDIQGWVGVKNVRNLPAPKNGKAVHCFDDEGQVLACVSRAAESVGAVDIIRFEPGHVFACASPAAGSVEAVASLSGIEEIVETKDPFWKATEFAEEEAAAKARRHAEEERQAIEAEEAKMKEEEAEAAAKARRHAEEEEERQAIQAIEAEEAKRKEEALYDYRLLKREAKMKALEAERALEADRKYAEWLQSEEERQAREAEATASYDEELVARPDSDSRLTGGNPDLVTVCPGPEAVKTLPLETGSTIVPGPEGLKELPVETGSTTVTELDILNPGVQIDFLTDAGVKSVIFTEYHGISFYKQLPIQVYSFTEDDGGEYLGVQQGWEMLSIGDKQLRSCRTYEEAMEIVRDELGLSKKNHYHRRAKSKFFE